MTEELVIGFLPYVRQGLAANADGPRRSCALEIVGRDGAGEVTRTVPRELELVGTGDIAGIAESMIARVFPPASSADMHYNLFPFVEFKDADFLWRYSYGRVADPREPRLRPWLALVVLRQGQYTLASEPLARDRDDQRMVTCVKPQGGDLELAQIADRLWAWAHVQLTDPGPPDHDKLAAMLKGEQLASVFSRLVCPVLLEKATAYSAFVVPADDALWSTYGKDARQVGYPVFYSWDFQTSDTPDFASLFERIELGTIDNCVLHVQASDCVDVGTEPAPAAGRPRDASVALYGALMPLRAQEPAVAPERRHLDSVYRKLRETTQLLQGCPSCRRMRPLTEPVQSCRGDDHDPAQQHAAQPMVPLDPYVGYPIYGARAANETVSPDQLAAGELPWLYETNAVTRRRIAAGLGAEVIRQHQDELVDYCWKHEQDLQREDDSAHREAAGTLLNNGLWDKHFAAPDSDRYIVRVAAALPPGDALTTLQHTGLTHGTLSAGNRKVVHQKIARRVSKPIDEDQRYVDYLYRRLNEKVAAVAPAGPPRMYDFSTPRRVLDGLAAVNAPGFVGAANRDNTTGFVGRINRDLAAHASRGRAATPVRSSRVTRVAREGIPYPMYTFLANLSRDYLIPNLHTLPNNRIVLLKPNAALIEAFLVGLNDELVRELVWREFPIRTERTLFHYFWDKDPDVLEHDIGEIQQWAARSRLGSHLIGADAVKSVLLIKADLVRHYHDLIIQVVVVDGAPSDVDWNLFLDHGEHAGFHPQKILFRCPLGDDTVFLGLPVGEHELAAAHLIFSENPSLPRFGLSERGIESGEIVEGKLARNHVRTLETSPGMRWVDPDLALVGNVTVAGVPPHETVWKHSARAAKHTLRLPVQIKIPFASF